MAFPQGTQSSARLVFTRTAVFPPRTDGPSVLRGVGAISGTAKPTVSVRAEYRPHGRALAYPHEDRSSTDSRDDVAERLAGSEYRDAQALRLKPHDHVDVISRRGRIRDVELRVTEIVAPGQVFVPFHFAETNANQVTQSAFDPISREPNYKQCAVSVQLSVSPKERRAKETQRKKELPVEVSL